MTRVLPLTALILACGTPPSTGLEDAGRDVALPDSGTEDGRGPDVAVDVGFDASEIDAGSDVAPDAFDAGPVDSGPPDAGPVEPLLMCTGPVGVWRGSEYWCENPLWLIPEHECSLVYESAGRGTWYGGVDAIRRARFVVEDVQGNTGVWKTYVCARGEPTRDDGFPGTPDPARIRQICETPLSRPCLNAARFENARYGVSYEALCAAAREHAPAPHYLFSDYRLGCPSPL